MSVKHVNEYYKQICDQYKEMIGDIQDLEKVCQADWKGKACENYLQNLRKDSNHCAEQFDALFNVLVSVFSLARRRRTVLLSMPHCSRS